MLLPPVPDTSFVLMLDFDGSLVELAPTPESIYLPRSLRQLLHGLYQKLQGGLACISGRSYSDLDSWLGSTGIDLVGSHGAEIGRVQVSDPCWSIWGQDCRHLLHDRWPQALIETKPQGLAIHWRRCPDAEPTIRAWIESHRRKWPQHVCIDGKFVAELRSTDCDKGHAVEHLMQQPNYSGRLPIYVGDDTTDLAAFKAVQAQGGWAIAVGNKTAGAADYLLPDPMACRQWLQQLHQLV